MGATCGARELEIPRRDRKQRVIARLEPVALRSQGKSPLAIAIVTVRCRRP